MPLSELQGQIHITNQKTRKFLREQLEMKAQVEETLESDDLSPFEEEQLREAIEILDNNIQRIRMAGIL